MRYILMMIFSISGDLESVQIPIESYVLCDKAKHQMQEAVAKNPGTVEFHGAYCLEVRH